MGKYDFEGKSKEETEDILIDMAVRNFFEDFEITAADIYDYYIDLYNDRELEPDEVFLDELSEMAFYTLQDVRDNPFPTGNAE